jgi:hypothetical protein
VNGAAPAAPALDLAGRGLAVLPVYGIVNGRCGCGDPKCSSPGKHPRTKHGHRDATVDADQIRMWWRACPIANVGVRTGNGLLVLDIDPRNGGVESLAALQKEHGAIPLTVTVRTGGGGLHYYFRAAASVRARSGVLPGIDLKSDGGFVVAPPSVHRSGKAYGWAPGRAPSDVKIAEAPSWLLELAAAGKTVKIRGAQAPKGTRNDHLMSVAGRLRRAGADEAQLREALNAENVASCQPPLDEGEVARVAASATRYPSGAEVHNLSEILESAGSERLNERSSTEEREQFLRLLKEKVRGMDATARALLRDELVRRFRFSAVVADAVLRSEKSEGAKQQGGAMLFDNPEPWDEAVGGAALLNEIEHTIGRYVILPVASAIAVSLWILHTHAIDAAQISPRLGVVSPEKRCGKSTVLKLLGALVRRPLHTTNVTTAVVFRTIEAHQPTLLVDEADTFLREREELRGVLNAGHDRQSAKVARCVGDESEPRVFNVWAPVAFAGIGKQHDTLMDRSIVIAMKRRAPSEAVEPFRRKQRDGLLSLHRKCVRWSQDNLERLRGAEPVPAAGLDDRAVDNWEALLAIADTAGGNWPEKARSAAQSLSSAERGRGSDALGEQLLADVRTIFEDAAAGAVSARDLLERLLAMEERPWAEAQRGRPLTARTLGTRLGRFGISSRTARIRDVPVRSYVKGDFEDAFSRYLPAAGVTSVTTGKSSWEPTSSEVSPAGAVPDGPHSPIGDEAREVTVVTDECDADELAYADQERAAIEEFGS